MTYLRSLLLTILAVLALTSPSLAVGAAAISANQASVAIAVPDGGTATPILQPCSRQGGKGMLICHPDLGLPIITAAAPLWIAARVPVPTIDMTLPDRAPKIEPPPPRRR
jgi:hypothetical protein